MNWILTPSGRSSRAPPPASLFSDSDWPSTLNRPSFNAGTNFLTWVGPSGGGPNNGSPVQQSRHLTDTNGFTTTSNGQIIEGLNVNDGNPIQIAHNNVTVRQCRVILKGLTTFDFGIQYGSGSTTTTGLIVEDCLIDGGTTGAYEGLASGSGNMSGTSRNFARRCYFTGFENCITLFPGSGIDIIDNLFGACKNASGTFDADQIELYTTTDVLVQHNMFDGAGSQTTPGIVNSLLNLTGSGGTVSGAIVNNNMFANGNVCNGFVIGDDNTNFSVSFTFTNNGFFNRGAAAYRRGSTSTLVANSGNYNAATQAATSGTLINGTGAI